MHTSSTFSFVQRSEIVFSILLQHKRPSSLLLTGSFIHLRFIQQDVQGYPRVYFGCGLHSWKLPGYSYGRLLKNASFIPNYLFIRDMHSTRSVQPVVTPSSPMRSQVQDKTSLSTRTRSLRSPSSGGLSLRLFLSARRRQAKRRRVLMLLLVMA